MKKTIRKNFRFSEMDDFRIECIRVRLSDFDDNRMNDSEVVRACIGLVYDRLCSHNLSELEQHIENCLYDEMYFPGCNEDSEAINYSPSPCERFPEDVVERYPESTDDDPDLPF